MSQIRTDNRLIFATRNRCPALRRAKVKPLKHIKYRRAIGRGKTKGIHA